MVNNVIKAMVVLLFFFCVLVDTHLNDLFNNMHLMCMFELSVNGVC